jgi:hypothetical protein
MRIPARLLLMMVLPFAVIYTANAKPWWQPIDIETANPPSRYGFHVFRTNAQDKDRYVITVDPAAAAVLESASIGWIGTNKEPHKLEITKVDSQTKIEFTVPPEYLQPSSYLRLNSGPINYCGPENSDNFHGYQLRLDNIPRNSAENFSFSPTVRMIDGVFEFSYELGSPLQISGPPPEFIRQILAITLENTTQTGLSVPMRSDDNGLLETVKFVLPKEQVADFMLVVTMTHHADLTGAKAKKHYIGLGILAANAELAAEKAGAGK